MSQLALESRSRPERAGPAPPTRDVRSWVARLRYSRPRRVLLLLAAMWLISGFDLGFTIFAHVHGSLTELNPIAARFVDQGPLALAIYKTLLTLFGSAILWRYRDRALIEWAAWLVALASVAVSIHWYRFFLAFVDRVPQTQLVGI